MRDDPASELALGGPEEQYALLMECVADYAIFLMDAEGRVAAWNVGAERIFGYTEDEALGLPFDRFFSPEDIERGLPQKELQAAVAHGRASDDKWHVRKDGTQLWVSGITTALRDDDGGLRGFAKVTRDRTEHLQATETLRSGWESIHAERRRLTNLRTEIALALATNESVPTVLQRCVEVMVRHLDMAFARVWTLNETGEMLELQASAGLYTHLNGPHSRVPVGQFKIGWIAQNRQPHLTNSVSTDPRVSNKEWAKREKMVAFAGYPLIIEGRVVGVMAMFARRPLSESVLADLMPVADGLAQYLERKRAEQALRASEEFNRGIVASSSDCIKVLDLEGRLLSMSEAGRRLMEIADFEACRMADWLSFWEGADRETARQAMLVARACGKGSFQGYCPTALGTPKWWDVFVTPILDAHGRPERLLSVARDITDLKRAEQQAQEFDRRKDEFLAMLAHELRGPLAPIVNSLQILRLQGDQNSSAHQARETIERQVRQLSRLVDDLLDMSRIKQGQITLQKQPLEFAMVVSQAVETSRPLIEARKHGLTIALPTQTVRLEGDPVRLTQVLVNLLTNSAKYTPEGGRIDLSVVQDGSNAVLRVRDTGIGISPDMLPRVFDLFAQAERGADGEQGGLGIGLSLVRSLVELHGGTVAASSEGPGRGAEFVIHLPLLPEVPESEREPVQAATDLSPSTTISRRILVVDDNRDAAESLANLLKMFGHDVRTAHNGPSALEIAPAYCPEVVLLDIGLPGMNGLEVCRCLRGQTDGQRTLIVALTGYGQEEDRSHSREAGFNVHLVKPVDLDALQKLLANHEISGELKDL